MIKNSVVLLKNIIRLICLPAFLINRNAGKCVRILLYHRVTGDVDLELDIPYHSFQKQMHYLSKKGTILPYPEAISYLMSEKKALKGPVYAVTFDDAYADFYSHAMPVIKKYNIPVTLFISTGFIDDEYNKPVSRSFPGIEKLKPLTWQQIRELSCDNLVTIGAHSHKHDELIDLTDREIEGDISYSLIRFKSELNFMPRHFAYPRGAYDKRTLSIIQKYFDSASIVSGKIAKSSVLNKHKIPRIGIRKSDNFFWFKHRVSGRLWAEEMLISSLKRLKNNTR